MTGARFSRGIAMILAIVVLAILSVVVLQLVFTTRVEVALSQNSRDEHESDRAADAAVVGNVFLDYLDASERSTVRSIYDTPSAPGLVLLVRSDASREQQRRLRDAIEAFDRSEAAQQYRFGGFEPIEPRELETMRPYLRDEFPGSTP